MIPFNDFKRHYTDIKEEVDQAVERVLSSGWFILGPELEAFEKEFSATIGTTHCIGCNSGTDALFLALKALGIGHGVEVITTAVTAFPTITAIQMTGATPVVVDVYMTTGLIDPQQVERGITAKTAAIMPVHLYGQCCDMDAIIQISERKGIPIVEDCAQAAGASWRGTKAGNMGVMGAFSFYPTKNLGAFGDAGAICMSDVELAEELTRLRNYGQSDRYRHTSFGINSRLDELQAAILRVKLSHLDSWNGRRLEIATRFRQSIPKRHLLEIDERGDHVPHLFPILVNERDAFMKRLSETGVASLIHYPIPVFEQESFTGRALDCPNASQFCSQVVSLPLYPELTTDEIDHIATHAARILSTL